MVEKQNNVKGLLSGKTQVFLKVEKKLIDIV